MNNNLVVDNWIVTHEENKLNGQTDLIETYGGKIEIEKAEEYTYLGFVISSKGDNMANIRQMKNKSLGVIRKIFNKLNSLNLKQYYYECAFILMNVMLRGSCLYASEMYYNLKETELRQIERIEEGFMRKMFNTTMGCPITQLYLEFGQNPARFEIQKMRVLYMKYILEQTDESLLKKFFYLQLDKPTRGDWASTCLKDLEELNISLSLEEIRLISKFKFSKMVKERISENALKYIISKQGKKGKEILYDSLEMADYLKPTNEKLSICEKQEMFSVRNRMTEISDNFSKNNEENTCICGEKENMHHIYNCETLNEEKKSNVPYENIFNGEIKKQIEVFKQFKQNMKNREEIISNPHVISKGSAVISNVFSNG